MLDMGHEQTGGATDASNVRSGRTSDTITRKDQKEMDHAGNDEIDRGEKRPEKKKRHLRIK